MTNLQPEIDQIKQKTKRFNNAELKTFIEDSLSEIEKINNSYIKFFENPNEQGVLLISEIETKIEEIKSKYIDLFGGVEGVSSKIAELDKNIIAIKNYHKELLDGSESIKADIEDSQGKITDFYTLLFGDDGNNKGQEEIVKSAITLITNFNSELNKDGGIKVVVENARDAIIKAHTELFSVDDTNPGKYPALTKVIDDIETFKKQIEEKISPYITEKQEEITKIEKDIKTKGNEIDSLLSKATARTLAEGYLESMGIYGYIRYKNTNKDSNKLEKVICFLNNTFSLIKNFLVNLLNYILFISPLIIIGLVFAKPDLINEIFKIKNINDVGSMSSQYWYKISISTPLLWISWFGQKNISQRKRLFEEYNHKLRVVQMYLLFISNNNSYALEKEKMGKLETILLGVIERNPCKFLGKDIELTKDNFVVEIINAFKGNKKVKPKKIKKAVTHTENN